MILQPLKHALKGAKLELRGKISHRFCDFTDNSLLLTHIEKELLPIANACRTYTYKFKIAFDVDYSVATNMLGKILRFGSIDGCSNVLFDLNHAIFSPTNLPVDTISNWLNRSRNFNAISANGQTIKERILEIKIDDRILNISEMINDLKKVNFNYYD